MIKNTIFLIFVVLFAVFIDINFFGRKTSEYNFVFNNENYSLQYPFWHNYLDFREYLNYNKIVGSEYLPITVKIFDVSVKPDEICLLNREGNWKLSFNYVPLNYNCVQYYQKCGNFLQLSDMFNNFHNQSLVTAYYEKGGDPCNIYFEIPGFREIFYKN